MIRANVVIFGSLILATILGIFGQDIAYFISGNIVEVPTIYCLTVLTMLSVFLYLLTTLLTYIFVKKQQIKKNYLRTYITVICIFGLYISYWSLFVLAMWWG